MSSDKVSNESTWGFKSTQHTGSPQFLCLALLPVEDSGHAVGQFGPVRVQAAAPAGRKAGEEPRLLAIRSVASALFLARPAVTRHLQPYVLYQVPSECSAACFLDVQEHDHVLALDLEVHTALQVPHRKVVLFHIVRIRRRKDGHVLLGEISMHRRAEVDRTGRYVLVQNEHEEHGANDDQHEFAGPLSHGPSRDVHLSPCLTQRGLG